eukprot:3349154-Pyramimonas_sp.AAC.1
MDVEHLIRSTIIRMVPMCSLGVSARTRPHCRQAPDRFVPSSRHDGEVCPTGSPYRQQKATKAGLMGQQ